MDLYLQFGYGMRGACEELLSRWKKGAVILSPRDLKPQQLDTASAKIRAAGGEVLFDPQCFSRAADHGTLTSHKFWKTFKANSTQAVISGPGADALLQDLSVQAKALGITRHILPGLLAAEINDTWFEFHEGIHRAAPKYFGHDELITTVALSSEVTRSEQQIEDLLERVEEWTTVRSIYLVAESPSSYLVDDPIWLSNLMSLVAGLKLLNKKVIVGYANHQLLALACSRADAIASGSWVNVRSFPIEKFSEKDEDQVSRRAIWYYCPQALSEYKLTFLDVGQRAGILNNLRAGAGIDGHYADALFGGPMPTTINWKEPQPFLHYLNALRTQASLSSGGNFEDTVTRYETLLGGAEKNLKDFKRNGVLGQGRDFSDYLDVNRSALALFLKARRPQMRRFWPAN